LGLNDEGGGKNAYTPYFTVISKHSFRFFEAVTGFQNVSPWEILKKGRGEADAWRLSRFGA